jgi:hypothetical protein
LFIPPTLYCFLVLPSTEQPTVVPIQTVLPGRKRTSTIRLPGKDSNVGPVLQRLEEFETKTDKRLKALETNNVLTKQLMSAVSALNEEHKAFDSHQTDTTAQLQVQREHFQGTIQHVVSVVEKCVKKVDVLEEQSAENIPLKVLYSQVEVCHYLKTQSSMLHNII